MNWGYVLAIVGSNIAIAGIICGFIWWILGKLDADIRALSAKLDLDMKTQTSRIDAQALRTDQLYQMFIDLLKAKKGE